MPNGKVFDIGEVSHWEPPNRLVFSWRQATFAPDQTTEVEVRFESVGAQTRVTVEHRGWDSIPQAHVARHGMAPTLFLQRHGAWWERLLQSLNTFIAVGDGGGS